MGKKKKSTVRTLLSPLRIWGATLIGLIAALWLVFRTFDINAFADIQWTWSSTVWIIIAICLMGIRDLAYIIRIRILTDGQLSWRQAFQVIMLWEFSSSITPSVVGGAAIAVFIINKEGIRLGRSTAVVMTSAMMDEVFYITMVPLVILFIGSSRLFPVELSKDFFGITLHSEAIFWIGYGFIFFLTIIIIIALFFFPQGFKNLLVSVCGIRFLRRWKKGAMQTGDDIVTTAKEIKKKPGKFWVGAFASTYLSWLARFFVINCIILAFAPASEHLLIFARQLAMWVIMLISPTPGSAGVAELAFSGFLREFVPAGLDGTLALLWRTISFYPYLIIGALILPGWLQRVYLKRKLISFKKN